jgi:DNA-binding NarL/FixJ family response regulator
MTHLSPMLFYCSQFCVFHLDHTLKEFLTAAGFCFGIKLSILKTVCQPTTKKALKGHILIIEDEQIVAENLASIIKQHVGVSSLIVDSECEAITRFKTNEILLLISDINLYGQPIGPQIVQLLQQIKAVPVIYITAYSGDQELKAALDTHPVAYVLKPYLERQILVTIKMALATVNGEEKSSEGNVPKPTHRELEILQLIAEGLSSKKIADRLFISEHTVSTHRKNVLRRYQMESTMELVAFAVKNKWIKM